MVDKAERDNPHDHDLSRVFWEIRKSINFKKRTALLSVNVESFKRSLYKYIPEGNGGYIMSIWGDSVVQLLRDGGYKVNSVPHWAHVESGQYPRDHYYNQEGVVIEW